MKLVCDDRRCGWHGEDTEMLTAPNPFNPEFNIHACPKCREIGVLSQACDEPGCWKASTCGTPTAAGYRRTCGRHMPPFENHD
jgi:hypothetical protein